MLVICKDCGASPAANGSRCWSCSDKRRTRAACTDCGLPVKKGTVRCRACHLAQVNAVQRTTEGRQAMSERTKGIPKSEETRARMREALKRRDPESWEKGAAKRRGRPGKNAAPVGTTVVVRNRVLVKCEDGKWRLRYRLMWEEKHGPIPVGYMVHHINGNSMDDRDDNFQLVTKAEHTKIHRMWESSSANQPK